MGNAGHGFKIETGFTPFDPSGGCQFGKPLMRRRAAAELAGFLVNDIQLPPREPWHLPAVIGGLAIFASAAGICALKFRTQPHWQSTSGGTRSSFTQGPHVQTSQILPPRRAPDAYPGAEGVSLQSGTGDDAGGGSPPPPGGRIGTRRGVPPIQDFPLPLSVPSAAHGEGTSGQVTPGQLTPRQLRKEQRRNVNATGYSAEGVLLDTTTQEPSMASCSAQSGHRVTLAVPHFEPTGALPSEVGAGHDNVGCVRRPCTSVQNGQASGSADDGSTVGSGENEDEDGGTSWWPFQMLSEY